MAKSAKSLDNRNQHARCTKRAQRQAEAKAALRRMKISGIGVPAGGGPGADGSEAEFERASDMALAFEVKMAEYKKNPFFKLFRKRKFSPASKTYPHYLKAADEALSLGYDFATWIEAQFYWFDKWFGQPPKPWQLSGGKGKMPARVRVEAYLRQGKGLAKTTSKVSKKKPRKLTRDDVLAYNAKLLQDMMRDGSTEKACLLEFAQEGMNVFDSIFLVHNETYRRLVHAGRI